jgi:hypothetical protein
MRTRRTAVTIACLALLLAGCGSSDDETAAEPSASSSAAEPTTEPTNAPSGEPTPEPSAEPDDDATPSAEPTGDATGASGTGKLTKAEAKRLAAAAILTKADLPGYTAKAGEDSEDEAADKKIYGCLGVAKPKYLTRDWGRAFTKGDLEIDSSADVVESVSAAEKEIHAFKNPAATACVKDQFTGLFAGTGAQVTKLTVDPVKPTVAGADDAFGFRLSITLSGPGGTAEMTGLIIGTLVGPVEISVASFQTGSDSFTLKKAEALAAISTRRVKAAL